MPESSAFARATEWRPAPECSVTGDRYTVCLAPELRQTHVFTGQIHSWLNREEE